VLQAFSCDGAFFLAEPGGSVREVGDDEAVCWSTRVSKYGKLGRKTHEAQMATKTVIEPSIMKSHLGKRD
jgi:hypothetical protein